MDKVEIKSSKTDATLSFSNLTKSGFQAAYQSKDIFVKIDVYDAFQLGASLQDMFALMAKHPKGWEGELNWGSLEEELEIYARVDRLGHVELSLVFNRLTIDEHWRAETTLLTELGQLEKIFQDMQEFFSSKS